MGVFRGSLKLIDSQITANNVALTGRDNLYVGGQVQNQRQDKAERQIKQKDGVTQTQTGYQQQQRFDGSNIQANDNVVINGGQVLIEGSKISGQSIQAKAGNMRIGGVATKDTDSTTTRNSKGLWFNETENTTETQQYHRSDLNATDSLAIESTGDLSVAGATLAGKQLALNAGNNLVATTELTENSQHTINRYENETAALKSGARTQTNATQQAHHTQISGDEVSLNSTNDQWLEGVNLQGQAVSLNSGRDLSVTSSTTQNRQNDEEAFEYWGGIGGGETTIDNHVQSQRNGSQINANNLKLTSGGNTKIQGSQVKAINEANVQANGTVTVTHDFDTEHDYQEARHGTALNITDQKHVTERQAQRTHGAQLSGSNLAISGDKVVLVGSQVGADKLLNIEAKDTLTTGIANATDVIETQHYKLTSGSNIDSPTDSNAETTANANIKGVTTTSRLASGTGTKNTLSAPSVTLKAGSAQIRGSDIRAANEVSITGNQVTLGAGEALVAENSTVVKRTGPDAYIKGGISGITLGGSIGTDQVIDQHHEYKALDTSIDAGQTVKLTAQDKLTNQGTQVTAATINLNAKDITNQASHDRVVDRHIVAGGKAALDAYGKTSPVVGGTINLSGEGTGQTTEQKRAHVTQLSASNNIAVNASGKALDEGTQMTAKDIKLTADDYEGTSAYDSAVTTVHAGTGKVNVDANTTNFNDININVGGKGQYQYLQQGQAKAIKGTLNANDVTIVGGKRAVAAQDVTANTYQIHATEEARIGQNNDKQWKTQGGAKVGGSVGATIIPAAQAGTPAFSTDDGFNYLQVDDSQAQVANINVQQLSVSADKLAQIDGAHITAKNVDVAGQQANIMAAQDRHRAQGVSLDGNATLSLSIANSNVGSGSAGLGGNLGVINETSNQAHGALINTQTLTVKANDQEQALTVEGANINADQIRLTNSGDVKLTAATSKSNVGNFAIGANASAGASSDEFKKGNIDGHLVVHTDDSRYYSLGNVKAGTIDIDAGNKLNLQSNIDADTLNVRASEGLAIDSAQDVVQKVDFESGVSIGGKPVIFKEDTSAEDVLNAFKDDFYNGTILGVKASGKLGLMVDHQQQTKQASVQANRLDANIGNDQIAVNAAKVTANNADIHGAKVTTSNNDDFVHTVGGHIAVKTPNLSQIVDDVLSGNELDSPIDIGGTYKWDDKDGDNTKAKVSL